jgi:hypothetical protein
MNALTNERGDPLVCYAREAEAEFRFASYSSLGSRSKIEVYLKIKRYGILELLAGTTYRECVELILTTPRLF